MDNATKARENRLRRAAARQGLVLIKSRTRDPRATSYGRWWVATTGRVLQTSEHGITLDEIETYLTSEA